MIGDLSFLRTTFQEREDVINQCVTKYGKELSSAKIKAIALTAIGMTLVVTPIAGLIALPFSATLLTCLVVAPIVLIVTAIILKAVDSKTLHYSYIVAKNLEEFKKKKAEEERKLQLSQQLP